MEEGWERFWKSGSVRDYLDCCGKNMFQESAGDHPAGACRLEETCRPVRMDQWGSSNYPEWMYRPEGTYRTGRMGQHNVY